jgi:hypothetical protein
LQIQHRESAFNPIIEERRYGWINGKLHKQQIGGCRLLRKPAADFPMGLSESENTSIDPLATILGNIYMLA